jgi:hypothetical protein
MSDTDGGKDGRSSRRTKVERLIDEYRLAGIGDELEHRWTADTEERASLRTLAADFNRRILERAMVDAGMDPIDGEVENVYRLLTDDDVSRGVRTEVESRLDRQDIDVESLRKDFVTYQAIRSFLQDVRGASYENETGDGIDRARSSFERLVGRTTAVVEQKLDQLRGTGRLTLGSFRVRTAVTVYCEDCQTQYDVTRLLERGGCDCEAGSE